MEKGDIIKFKKLCSVLISERDYSKNKIVQESGITWPTFQKLFNDDISEIKISASTLVAVQNYIKKHINVLNYAGIEAASISDEPILEIKPIPPVEKIRKKLCDYTSEERREGSEAVIEYPDQGREEPATQEEGKSSVDRMSDLIAVINSLWKEIPAGVTINITINGSKTNDA